MEDGSVHPEWEAACQKAERGDGLVMLGSIAVTSLSIAGAWYGMEWLRYPFGTFWSPLIAAVIGAVVLAACFTLSVRRFEKKASWLESERTRIFGVVHE